MNSGFELLVCFVFFVALRRVCIWLTGLQGLWFGAFAFLGLIGCDYEGLKKVLQGLQRGGFQVIQGYLRLIGIREASCPLERLRLSTSGDRHNSLEDHRKCLKGSLKGSIRVL